MGGTYQIFESSFFSKVSLTILIFRKKNLGPRASAELAISDATPGELIVSANTLVKVLELELI